jgi:mannose-6-phosphate isomerase-like protein (cupin superfamily)
MGAFLLPLIASNMKHKILPTLFGIFALCLQFSLHAQQEVKKLKTIKPDSMGFDNVHVKKIYNDQDVSSFLIWVKKDVKAHMHEAHTEQVWILDGKGLMRLGENTFKVKKGDWVCIPKGSVHSVKVIGKKPLKALSVQAPEFDGTDRVFVEEQK